MTRGVYLRANGELNCYCSTGEQIALANAYDLAAGADFVRDIYLGKRFEHIRKSFRQDVLPFARHCPKCNYLQPKAEYDGEMLHQTIEWVHMEASALCNLRCPFCSHGVATNKRSKRAGPHMLSRDVYLKVLDSIAGAGLGIRWMYFSGRGEPTLHPHIWQMVQDAKERFDTNFLVNSNGNAAFDPLIVESGLDKIKLALDSVSQDVYERYRIGGHVDTVLRLTRQIADYKARTGADTPTIVWQKVLFDFNSSPEEIAHYQNVAREHGVDRIRLFFTWTAGYSPYSPEDYDLFFPDVEIHNPSLRGAASLQAMESAFVHAQQTQSIPALIKVVSDHLHWLEHGTNDRVDYDRFAGMPLTSPELLAMRSEEEDSLQRKALFAKALDALATCYLQRGHEAQAKQYAQLAGKVNA